MTFRIVSSTLSQTLLIKPLIHGKSCGLNLNGFLFFPSFNYTGSIFRSGHSYVVPQHIQRWNLKVFLNNTQSSRASPPNFHRHDTVVGWRARGKEDGAGGPRAPPNFWQNMETYYWVIVGLTAGCSKSSSVWLVDSSSLSLILQIWMD